MEPVTGQFPSLKNDRTHFLDAAGAEAQRARRLGPRAAFCVAYDRLVQLADVAPGPSFAVVAVGPEARVVEALLLGDRRALVLGRHTRCGLRLPEESVALRHVAALARFEDARPVLRVWDLCTGSPFVTEDQQPCGAVVADGPLYIAVGSYAIWFVTVGGPRRFLAGSGAAEAWQALPERAFVTGWIPPARAGAPALHDHVRPERVAGCSTLITSHPTPLFLGEGDEPEVGWGTLRLAYQDHREKREVSAEALERGVLVGRYPRCGLMVEPEKVSRVHLLLVRIGAELWAIDAASTNGVRRNDHAIDAAVLGDVDALSLAAVTLEWKRQIHPSA